MIHDYIFTIGNAVLFFALFPTLRSKEKPALKTSLMTGTILLAFGINFASLGLYLSSVMVSATGLLWYILAWQKYNKK